MTTVDMILIGSAAFVFGLLVSIVSAFLSGRLGR